MCTNTWSLTFFLHDFFPPLRILGKIICLGISRWNKHEYNVQDNCHVFHTLCKDKITAKQRTARVAPARSFFCYVVFFPFFCENSCPVTVWPYCCRHGHIAAVQSSVKVTFTNILETILDQLGFEYEISMFCPKMVSNLAGNLCFLLYFIIVVSSKQRQWKR